MNEEIPNPFQPLMNKLDNLEKLIFELIENNSQRIESTNETLMSRKEVANYFNVSLTTLNSWSNKGILKRCRIASKVYYKKKRN